MGAFSVVDLFLLNALTIVTEFLGITLALDYLGLPKNLGVLASAAVVMMAVSTGSFRRFARFAVFLVFGSLLRLPVILLVHPSVGQLAKDFLVPKARRWRPDNCSSSRAMLSTSALRRASFGMSEWTWGLASSWSWSGRWR